LEPHRVLTSYPGAHTSTRDTGLRNDPFGISECEAAISRPRAGAVSVGPVMETYPKESARPRRTGFAADIGRALAALVVLALLSALDRLG